MFNLHHIDIWVTDIEKSICFYEDLGFKKLKEFNIDDNKKIILMELNDIYLELKYHCCTDCVHNVSICGDNKIFGLAVDDIYEAKKFFESLDLFEKNILVRIGILGKKYFLIKDPNGLLIEIIEK